MDSKQRKPRPRRATGPTSREGKERSSQNRLTHGMRCSEFRLLKDESREEFEALREVWMDEYDDGTPMGHELIDQAVKDHWLMKRADRRVQNVEAANEEGNKTPADWSEEQHHLLGLMHRYRNTAKRDLERSRRALEQRRGARIREEHAAAKFEAWDEDRAEKQEEKRQQKEESAARTKKAAEAAAEGQSVTGGASRGQKKKKAQKAGILEQWVEVTVEDGKTVTMLFPSNRNLRERAKKMEPAPELVYRRIHFVHGVPAEYEWACPDEGLREYGGCGIQRMTMETWLEVVEREAPELERIGYKSSYAPEHIGPTGVGNLPRPKERGGCECEVCVGNQEILDGAVSE
jgi:hypothetical protein